MGSFSRYSASKEIDIFGLAPLDGWPESSCSPSGTPAMDDLLRISQPEDSSDGGLRSELLAKAVEYEIIPRLMLAHRVPKDPAAHPLSRGELVSPADLEPFAELVLHADDADLRGYIADLRDRGVPVESIFLDLLAPVARHLGELWNQDLCTFTEVTMGLGRLQQLLRENSAAFAGFNGESTQDRPRRVLLMPCPGEQHTFGISLVGEFFHRAGWEVVTSFVTTDEASGMVQKDWYDVVGFSMACEGSIERLGEAVAQVRRKSRNPRISIIAGGAIFGLHPEFGNRLKADAIITDGLAAPALADKLVADSQSRSLV